MTKKEKLVRKILLEQYGDMDLKAAVVRLPEQEKALIILRFYEDKQLSEIADILAENLTTVKSRLYRTLKKLLAGQEDYRKTPVPEEMRVKLEAGIARAQAERTNRIRRFRIAAAAAAAVLVILPNTGAGVAHAMGRYRWWENCFRR